MSNASSSEIAALDQDPPQLVDTTFIDAPVRIAYGSMAIGTANLNVNDLWRMVRLNTKARIIEIRLSSTVGGVVVIDVGVYKKLVVKNATAYGSGLPGTGNHIVRTSAGLQERLWQDAGDARDFGGSYDIVAKVTSVSGAVAGTLYWNILYVLS